MSTPRTDAASFKVADTIFHPGEPIQVVSITFARQLETELAEADFATQQERNIHMTTIAERDQLRAEVERLKAGQQAVSQSGAVEFRQEAIDDFNRFADAISGEPEIARLRAQLAAAKEDTARLDWLLAMCPMVTIDGKYMLYSTNITTRAAIDQARKEGSK